MKTRTVIVVSAGLGGLILLGWFYASRRPYLARQTLPDGATLTLVAVKAGQKHESPLATLKQKLAARLPASWCASLKVYPPASTSCQISSSNYLSVWLTAAKTKGVGPPQFILLVGDDHDNFCIDAEHHGTIVSSQVGPNQWLVGLPVAAWPRRAETIRIQVYARYAEPMFYPTYREKMIAEFRVKNPGRDTKAPAWTAPPWPITVRDGDLDFTLTSLWLGLGSLHGHLDGRLWALKDPSQRSSRATFRVTRGDEVLTNWNAHHVRKILDATGNWSDGNGYNSLIRDGETLNQFSRPPLPASEAWRMTVEFSRMSGFSTDEVYTVTGIATPLHSRAGLATNALGTNVLEMGWARRSPDGSIALWASARPLRNDHKLTLVRATDNLGRDVPFKNSGGGQSVTHEDLTLSTNATSVDLVFAFHRSRLLTFQVKPEFYRPSQK